MIRPFKGVYPRIAPSAYIEETAIVIGDVEVGDDSSIWYNTVVRGDIHFIRIGSRTNIQDLCMLHVRHGSDPVNVGDDVSVGHHVILHGCTLEDRVLVGMGAIIMDGAVVGKDCLVGAGSLVPPGMNIPPRSLVMGSPARIKREVSSEELAWTLQSSRNYIQLARLYQTS